MPFVCQQCGECCSHMGDVHVIIGEDGAHGFILRNRYTGEQTPVSVDPDKIDLFSDHRIFSRFPDACPFLRDDPANARICCTVHLTRPAICREYECWRLLVLDRSGRRAGRIMGSRYLCSGDEFLSRIWDRAISPMEIADPETWDRDVIRILRKAGYTVRW